MATWTKEDLERIGGAEEVQVAPLRGDGTPRRPVTIWIVRVGDDLYVRSYRGAEAASYRAARASGAGRLLVGNLERDVAFRPEADPGINDQIDEAYRTKYRRYLDSYVPPMLTPTARSTTLRVLPS